jgi:hypothetical protein
VQPKRLKGQAYAKANEDKSKKLKEIPSNDEDLEAVAVPVKHKSKAPVKVKVSTKKEAVSNSGIVESQVLPGPKRVFEGVVPPKVDGADAKAWLSSSASDLSSTRKVRRKSAARKSLSIIGSDDSDDSEEGISDKQSDDSFDEDSGASESEIDDEMEPSSSSDVVLISDDDSDVPDKKKRKPQPKALKKPAKVAKEVAGKRGQKRKNMDSDEEQEENPQEEGPPAKKAKVIKPKKVRATTDPWHLGDGEVQKDWTLMRAPPLDMFHFHRVVVDEFTYTKKEHVSHAIVTQLSATCRWVMSGTPPTGDFASVKGIATFLGIHLGVDDDAEGTTEEVKSRIQDKTAAETFHSFRDVRSAYWHAARHQTAQGFLDKFVRQVSGHVLFHN